MKLKFKQQQYQEDAALSVVNIFSGQQYALRQDIVNRQTIDYGVAGKVTKEQIAFSNAPALLPPQQLLKNIQEVQRANGLFVSKEFLGFNFSIEMETGTGKTYVYTKTMFELNKEYGWSKFIVLVPSIAIREGVHKSFEITADHFQELYGKKIRFSIYNTQNKSNLINIKNFADTSNIEVIIMNYQAFNVKQKDKELRSEAARKIYQQLDALQSEKPIEILKRSRPILIIDEPQRFGSKAEVLLNEFDPLFILRYSATHKKDREYHKIYRLDAIDAYNQKLVKKISVKGIQVSGNAGTNSYLFLDRIQISTDKYPHALIELEVKQVSGIKKTIRRINEKDDLYSISNELQQYRGFIVSEINGLKNTVSFTNGVTIRVGETLGDVDEEHVRRIQIRETIKSHLDKERFLYPKGIKVLSLFFIDEVAKYRLYDQHNNQTNGDYARIFEEEYTAAVSQLGLYDEEFNQYISSSSAADIHKGYFSIDNKGRFVNSISASSSERDESSDVSAYELIMKRKEQLLSLSEPTRFIFSHSALREGWDNPNVFQICTLKHSESTISKRQEIGRGLRICVNNNGDRMDTAVLGRQFFDFNTLTVVASESYEEFAKQLQQEIVESLSDRPVSVTVDILNKRELTNKHGKTFTFDDKSAMNLIFDLKMKGYLDNDYKLTPLFAENLEAKKIEVTSDFEEFKDEITKFLGSIYDSANFKATEEDDSTMPNPLVPNDNFLKDEFKALWDKIKIKTVYEVNFNTDELIRKCIPAIDANLQVKKVTVTIQQGGQKDQITLDDLQTGESMEIHERKNEYVASLLGSQKFDLIGEIAKAANLTRKTVVKILMGIKPLTFAQYQMNPESFIREVTRLINQEKAATLIGNVIYSRTDQSYDNTIFTLNHFKGKLGENVMQVKKHVHDYLKYDSRIEHDLAKELETGQILVYAKLPKVFKIPTPVGDYNPDWAIVFDTPEVKYVYFIAETKGTLDSLEFRESEKQKIEYAKKHFEALGHADIKYDVITNYNELMQKVMK